MSFSGDEQEGANSFFVHGGGDLNCRVHAVLRGRARVHRAPGGEPSHPPSPKRR